MRDVGKQRHHGASLKGTTSAATLTSLGRDDKGRMSECRRCKYHRKQVGDRESYAEGGMTDMSSGKHAKHDVTS